MFLDKLLKKDKKNKAEEADKMPVAQEPEADEEISKPGLNESYNAFEDINLDLELDNSSDEEMLKGLNLDIGSMEMNDEFSEKNSDEIVNDMLDAALDLFGNEPALDSIKKVPEAPKPAPAPEPEPVAPMDSQLEDELASALSDDDMDSMIASALEKDKKQAASIDLDAIDTDFINDTAVFNDPNNVDTDSKLHVKRENKLVAFFNKFKFRTLLIAAGVLSVCVIASVAGTFYLAMNNTMLKRIENMPGGMIIYQPLNPINNANFIYVRKGLVFQDSVLSIDKLLIDSQGTVFYFDKKIPTDKYNVTLTDDKGKRYAPNLMFLNLQSTEEGASVLYFEPLDVKVSYFSLGVQDAQTGEEVEYFFGINDKIALPPTKYVGTSMDLLTNSFEQSVFIEGMTFSSMGTVLNYSMRWSDSSRTLNLGKNDNALSAVITEDKRPVTQLAGSHTRYYFDGADIVLGQIIYNPLRNLISTVDVKFSDFYKRFEVGAEVAAGGLFRFKEKNYVEIELNEFKFVLERAGWQVDKLLLVSHTEPINLFAVSNQSQDYDNRLETRADVRVKIEKPNGEFVILEGRCMTGPMGMDIIFDAADYVSEIKGISHDKYTFLIDNVYIKSDDLTYSYNVESARYSQTLLTSNFTTAVTDAFKSRLAFKSGRGDIFSVTGFSEALSSSDYLMRNYNPAVSEDAIYTAQVLNCAIIGDEAYAVVAEYWNGRVDGKLTTITETHLITAERNNEGWVIISDEITNK